MELIMVHMLVMSLNFLMVNLLAQKLELWMGSHLVNRGIGQISTDFCFDTFSVIESSGRDSSTSFDFH